MNKLEAVKVLIEQAIANRKKVLIVDPKGELEAVQREHTKIILSCVEYAQTEEWIDTMMSLIHTSDKTETPWVIIVNGYKALQDFGRDSETLENIAKFTTPEFIRRGYELHWLAETQPNLDGEIAESFRRNGIRF
jgi:hypothetical protein